MLAAVAPVVLAGTAAGGVASYQMRLHDRAIKFAAAVHAEEVCEWEAECKRIVEEHGARERALVADQLARNIASEQARRESAEQAAREEKRHQLERRHAEEEAHAEAEAKRLMQEAEDLRKADEQRTQRVRAALVWWTTEHALLDERAQAFWPHIIKQAPKYLARYDDPTDLCGTAERCWEVASWALDHIPAEVGYFLTDGTPNVSELATILRRHHGRAVEGLLPRARALQRDDLLRPAPVVAAAAPAPSPFSDLLSDLPAALQAEMSKNIHAAMHLDQVRAITAKIVEHRKEQLEAEGVAHDVIDERLAALDDNLGRATREFARKRGFV